MAIEVSVSKNENKLLVNFPNSYCIINRVNTDDKNANVELCYYVNASARAEHKLRLANNNQMPMAMDEPYILRKNVNIQLSEINTLQFNADETISVSDVLKKACYTHIMKLDEFKNSIAV